MRSREEERAKNASFMIYKGFIVPGEEKKINDEIYLIIYIFLVRVVYNNVRVLYSKENPIYRRY